jgi:alkanesulfonate monooxygenase SsuD/methylene tetrahydromethanopterin reductase-like flavin-dependent oxidoreductase (luciferase family)
MKFGISYHSGYHGVDPDAIAGYARHAEECGFESFYLPEHVVLYVGATLGSVPFDPSIPFLDPLDCLSFVAGATERIVLGTGVLQLRREPPGS